MRHGREKVREISVFELIRGSLGYSIHDNNRCNMSTSWTLSLSEGFYGFQCDTGLVLSFGRYVCCHVRESAIRYTSPIYGSEESDYLFKKGIRPEWEGKVGLKGRRRSCVEGDISTIVGVKRGLQRRRIELETRRTKGRSLIDGIGGY